MTVLGTDNGGMRLYLAPMEGITGYVYRNAQHRFYNHIDKYFTPFITPTQNRKLTSKEMNDILPEHNQGMYVVPQILTNQAEGFLWAAEKANPEDFPSLSRARQEPAEA